MAKKFNIFFIVMLTFYYLDVITFLTAILDTIFIFKLNDFLLKFLNFFLISQHSCVQAQPGGGNWGGPVRLGRKDPELSELARVRSVPVHLKENQPPPGNQFCQIKNPKTTVAESGS